MTGDAVEALAAIRALVEQAKGVPMTQNAIVSRAELLSLVDRAQAAVGSLAEEPVQDGPSNALVDDAQAEADRILADAKERAGQLVASSEVVTAAQAEATAFKHEADTWVDSRLSELETGLNRTLEQIETMRDRLHQRSRIEDDE